jgi:hypothetical protein
MTGRTVALPKIVLEKLAKLIPRLASNHPGEVVATVAAIRRTLQNAGADLHDLGEALDADAAPEWRDQVLLCRRNWDLLLDRERGLVESLERWRGTPTAKQLAFLKNVHESAGRRRAQHDQLRLMARRSKPRYSAARERHRCQCCSC